MKSRQVNKRLITEIESLFIDLNYDNRINEKPLLLIFKL